MRWIRVLMVGDEALSEPVSLSLITELAGSFVAPVRVETEPSPIEYPDLLGWAYAAEQRGDELWLEVDFRRSMPASEEFSIGWIKRRDPNTGEALPSRIVTVIRDPLRAHLRGPAAVSCIHQNAEGYCSKCGQFLGYVDPGPTAFDMARDVLRGPRAHVYDNREALALLEGLVCFGIGLRRIGDGFVMATWEMRHGTRWSRRTFLDRFLDSDVRGWASAFEPSGMVFR